MVSVTVQYPEVFLTVSSLWLLCSCTSYMIAFPRLCPRLPGLLWTHCTLWLAHGHPQPRPSPPVVTADLCPEGQAQFPVPAPDFPSMAFTCSEIPLCSFLSVLLDTCYSMALPEPEANLSSAFLWVLFSFCCTGHCSRVWRWVSLTLCIHVV